MQSFLRINNPARRSSLATARNVRACCGLALVMGMMLIAGCDNTPTASTQPFQMLADFRAFHLVDERQPEASVIDTVYFYFAGNGLDNALVVKVNGAGLPRVAIIGQEALFAGNLLVEPGMAFKLDVSNNWQKATNMILVPNGRPQLSAPVSDSVYARDRDIGVKWSGADTGAVYIELSVGDATTSIDDTLWTANRDASDGGVIIPSTVWADRSDTTAILSLWYTRSEFGDGFDGGLLMIAGAGVRRLVRVRAPGAARASARPAGSWENRVSR